MIGRAFDSIAGIFSKAVNRKEARARLQGKKLQTRRYEAASFSDKTKGWYAPKSSSIVETKLYLSTLRDRSRDLVRNNAIARRGLDVLTSNVIGAGIVPKIHCESTLKRQKIEDHLKRFIDECDYSGRLDFYGLQALHFRSMLEAGESLMKFVYLRKPMPLKLYSLEADFIDPYKEGYFETGLVCQGIEFAKPNDPTQTTIEEIGKPQAYWLYRNHPGGFLFNGFTVGSIRIPASDIVHCFQVERPGQVRGIPKLTCVALKLRDLDQYSFAQLSRQKLSACYAGFIRDVNEQLDSVASKDEDYLEQVQPGMIEYLPFGKDIVFNNPPDAPNYPDYMRACIREIAAGLGISFEALSNDYSQVNFSSARMGWLEFHRTVQSYQWVTFIPGWIQPVMNKFLEMVSLLGVDTSDVTLSYTPPRREMIDPKAEIESMAEGLSNGFFSLSHYIREQGYEPEQQLKELASDKKLAESLGLNLTWFSENKNADTQTGNSNQNQKKDERGWRGKEAG